MVLAMPNMLDIQWPDGQSAALSTLWLRDNCPCSDCRVSQTQEKRFHIATVPIDYAPDLTEIHADQLIVRWPEGHESHYSREFLTGCAQPIKQDWQPWREGFLPQYADYTEFLSNDQISGISRFKAFKTLRQMELSALRMLSELALFVFLLPNANAQVVRRATEDVVVAIDGSLGEPDGEPVSSTIQPEIASITFTSQHQAPCIAGPSMACDRC